MQLRFAKKISRRMNSTIFGIKGEGQPEISVGISIHVNNTLGFTGILKQRYSDFIVREVAQSGVVVRLNSTNYDDVEKCFGNEALDSRSSIEPAQIVSNFMEEFDSLSQKELVVSHLELREFLSKVEAKEKLQFLFWYNIYWAFG